MLLSIHYQQVEVSCVKCICIGHVHLHWYAYPMGSVIANLLFLLNFVHSISTTCCPSSNSINLMNKNFLLSNTYSVHNSFLSLVNHWPPCLLLYFFLTMTRTLSRRMFQNTNFVFFLFLISQGNVQVGPLIFLKILVPLAGGFYIIIRINKY